MTSAANETLAKRLKFWITLAIALMAGGFSTAVYLSRYALAADLSEVTQLTSQHESRISILEEQNKRIEDELHTVSRQLFEIARAVGAPEVPTIVHRKD